MNQLKNDKGFISWVLPEPLDPTTLMTLFSLRFPSIGISYKDGAGFLPNSKEISVSSAKE
jgi:hypothetical protein